MPEDLDESESALRNEFFSRRGGANSERSSFLDTSDSDGGRGTDL